MHILETAATKISLKQFQYAARLITFIYWLLASFKKPLDEHMPSERSAPQVTYNSRRMRISSISSSFAI
jgi:hypothetical protein